MASNIASTITVGVLALQGAFREHLQLLEEASREVRKQQKKEEEDGVNRATVEWRFIEVRSALDLGLCDALIIPGGESTTMSLVAARNGLLEPLREFVK